MPFDFSRLSPTLDRFGMPQSGSVRNEHARIDYDNGRVHVAMTASDDAPDRACELLDEVAQCGRISPADQRTARQLIRDCARSRETAQRRSIYGTRITAQFQPVI